MKLVRYGMALLCSALLASAAVAEEEKIGSPADDFGALVDCDLTGYKSEVVTFPGPIAIPDNVVAGVTFGPVLIPADGALIDDVIIDINFGHSWMGDVIAVVGYDATCDGSVDAQTVLLCRVGRATCVGGTGFGCSSNFGTSASSTAPGFAPYHFSDAMAVMPCPAATPGFLAAGCYKPTGVGAGLLSVFDNMVKGGCWYLNMSDNAGADLGSVAGWSVHIKNRGTVGVEPAAWGSVKTLYN
jgi:hypothetical protein